MNKAACSKHNKGMVHEQRQNSRRWILIRIMKRRAIP